MDKEEQLWERLAPIVLEREHGFGDITVGRATDQQGKDNLLNFIFQELDKAREEGVKMGMENAWEMVSALLDTLDINKNEEEIRILTGINKLFDREITKLALKLKNNK